MNQRKKLIYGLLLVTVTVAGLCELDYNRAQAASKSGTLVVLNKAANTAALVDAKTLRVIGTAPTGDGPHEVAVSPDGRFAYVANYGRQGAPGHTLTVIDLRDKKEAGAIDLGEYTRPHGIVVSKDGQRIYVTCEGSKAVVVVNAKERKVSHAIHTDQEVTHMIVITPDETCAYTANIGSGTVTALDLVKREVITHINIGAGAEGIDISPDGKTVYAAARAANKLSKIDTTSNKIIKQVETQAFPIRVKVTPDGQRVLVTNAVAGTLQVFAAATLQGVKQIKVGQSPVGILIEPNGQRAYVARTRDDKVSVIDLKKWEVVGEIQPGDEPDGLGYAR
ncbi:MAG: beta-propeller fold lactonase family protein [Acidobacteria bacterium]|nr:beta-propeller fold lactonase family protein [Acidobacteriota bacterium]